MIRGDSQPQDSKRQLQGLIGDVKDISSKQFSDADQWTERIFKPQFTNRIINVFDKHKSCSQIDQEDSQEDIHIRKFSQFITLSKNIIPRLLHIQKKIKVFKAQKDADYNSCASTIAKMKCFCLDNAQNCFDFYRCTDLIMLKYMIYLMIAEMNNPFSELPSPKTANNSMVETSTNQLKQILKETVGIVYEIIEEIKNTKIINQPQKVENLNNQLSKIQQKIRAIDDKKTSQQPYLHSKNASAVFLDSACTTPQTQGKRPFDFPHSQSQRKIESTETKVSPVSQTQKIIQFQLDELNIKNDQINKLHQQITKLQKEQRRTQLENSQLLQQLQEVTTNLQLATKTIKQQEDEISVVKNTYEQMENNAERQKTERDQYYSKYRSLNDEYQQLKRLFDEFQKNNQIMHKEYTIMKNQINQQQQSELGLVKSKKDDEISRLTRQLNEKQMLVQSLAEDATTMGRQLKQVTEQILNVNTSDLPKELRSLQQQLLSQEQLIQSKVQNIEQFQQSIQIQDGFPQMQLQTLDLDCQTMSQSILQSEMRNSLVPTQATIPQNFRMFTSTTSLRKSGTITDQIKLQATHSDLMSMLLIQCDTIEKLVEQQ
ncbi:hypothetical protein pb186bvf_016323 [Paramecium bursaria]